MKWRVSNCKQKLKIKVRKDLYVYSRLLGDLELRETKSSKGAGLGIRLNVMSREQANMKKNHNS